MKKEICRCCSKETDKKYEELINRADEMLKTENLAPSDYPFTMDGILTDKNWLIEKFEKFLSNELSKLSDCPLFINVNVN